MILWVLTVHKRVSTRSGALWEELKNALRVSPELGEEETEAEEEEKLDIKNIGEGHNPEGGSLVVDDDGTDRSEELAEPISALSMTGAGLSQVFEYASQLATPGNEEEQTAGAMGVIGEKDEGEEPSTAGAEVVPERASRATADLDADQGLLDTSCMVGLTIVSRSRRMSIDNLDYTHMDTPISYRSPASNAHQGTPCSQGTSQRWLSSQHSLKSEYPCHFISFVLHAMSKFSKAPTFSSPLAHDRAREDTDQCLEVLASSWQLICGINCQRRQRSLSLGGMVKLLHRPFVAGRGSKVVLVIPPKVGSDH